MVSASSTSGFVHGLFAPRSLRAINKQRRGIPVSSGDAPWGEPGSRTPDGCCPGKLRPRVQAGGSAQDPDLPSQPSHVGRVSLNPGSGSPNLGSDVASSSSGTQRASGSGGSSTGTPGVTGDAVKWLADRGPSPGCGVAVKALKQAAPQPWWPPGLRPAAGICRGAGQTPNNSAASSRGARPPRGFPRAARSSSILAFLAITGRRGRAQASRDATSTPVGVKRRGTRSAVPAASQPASPPRPSALRREAEERPFPCRSGNLNWEILSLDPRQTAERPRLAQMCWQAKTVLPASYSLEARLRFRLRACK